MSQFIVIEKSGGWEFASIIVNESGENKVFNTLAEAMEESDDCQDGIVVGDELVSMPLNKVIVLMHYLLPRLVLSHPTPDDVNSLKRLRREVESCL